MGVVSLGGRPLRCLDVSSIMEEASLWSTVVVFRREKKMARGSAKAQKKDGKAHRETFEARRLVQ